MLIGFQGFFVGCAVQYIHSTHKTIVLQNVELQNVELQNAELQNADFQNNELQNAELQSTELQNAESYRMSKYKTSNLTERRNTKRRKYMYSNLYEKFPWAFLPVNSVIREVVAEMKGYSVG